MFYYVKLEVEKIIYDKISMVHDTDYYFFYTINSYKSKHIKSVQIVDKNINDCIGLVIKTESVITEKKVIEDFANDLVDGLKYHLNRLNVFRQRQFIRRLSLTPIKKSIATTMIKKYLSLEEKHLVAQLKTPYQNYFKLIRIIVKKANAHNFEQLIPLLSTVMKKDQESKAFKQAFMYLLRSNYFLKHRVVDCKTLNNKALNQLLTEGNQYAMIVIFEENHPFFTKSLLRKGILNNDFKHGYIVTSTTSEMTTYYDFHFIIGTAVDASRRVFERNIVDESLLKLNQLIGLEEVKEKVKEIMIYYYIQKKHHDTEILLANHFAFLGNPGTGKTTVARLLSSFFYKAGILKTGQTIEVDRSDLVGEYIGKTAQKTRSVLKSADGGVLFIDEAYSLYGEGRDFGKEAIHTITKYMEDNRNEFMCIFAGYEQPMQMLMTMNPGLEGRINHHIHFQDFSPEEMCFIFKQMTEHESFTYEEALYHSLYKYFSSIPEQLCNGREVRQQFENIKRHYALRLYQNTVTKVDIKCLKDCDFKEPIIKVNHNKIVGFRR